MQTYEMHYLNHVPCLNILNQLIYCENLKKSLKHGQDQNTNAAYANENETSSLTYLLHTTFCKDEFRALSGMRWSYF